MTTAATSKYQTRKHKRKTGEPHTLRCSKCGDTKPIVEFARANGYANGRRRQCRECRRTWRSA